MSNACLNSNFFKQDLTSIKMKQKKVFFLLLLSVLLISLNFISAVPPVTTLQQFAEGYYVQIPQDNFLTNGQGYEFNFHVYNISNQNLITSGLSCEFELYNSTGSHIYEAMDSTSGPTGDYSFWLEYGNFTDGNYPYYFITCNSSERSGFNTAILFVNPTGIVPSEAQGNLTLGVIISIIALIIFFGFLSFKFIETDETFGIGLFFLVISLILSVYILFLGFVLSRDFLFTSISAVQEKVFTGIMFALVGIMFIAFTFLIIKVVKTLKVQKIDKQYGEGYNSKTKQYEY